MAFYFDHALVFVPEDGAIADRLVEAGLVEGPSNVHPGQGTRNRRFYFEGGMLELIWVHDEAEARRETTARTRIWERARWPETAACPFGVGWTRDEAEATEAPFAFFRYTPDYLADGVSIAVACASEELDQPLGFVLPGWRRPELDRAHIEHSPHRLTRVQLASPELFPLFARAGDAAGLLTFAEGEPLMTLTLDEGATGRRIDLREDGVPLLVLL